MLLFLLPVMISRSEADNGHPHIPIKNINEANMPNEIKGLPVREETADSLAAFLQGIQWKSMPINSLPYGLIKGFACNQQQNKCVLDLNYMYFYEENICKAVYSFCSEGSYEVFSDSNKFFILFNRGNLVLQFDENNNTVLYKLNTERFTYREWDILNNIGLKGNSISITDGDYCIYNQHPRILPIISASYDTFSWKGFILYENSLRKYYFIVIGCISVFSLIILTYFLITKKKSHGN